VHIEWWKFLLVGIAAVAGLSLGAAMGVSPAHAVSMHECSVKYKAAQDAGTLSGMKWNDFRKANCGSSAAAPVAPATKPAAAAIATQDPGEPNVTNTEHTAEPRQPRVVAPKGVVFPTAVSAKYSGETPAKARMHTCLDQYHADKANGALGGLKWLQKGGGYYSLCNAGLKS
jgi:hypothetical protein